MANTDFSIKQGSSGLSLDVTLLNDDDTPVDLTDATSVDFIVRPEESETASFTKAAIVVDPPTDGNIRYVWAVGDTDAAGTFYGEFTVNFPSGPVSYPADGYLVINIEPNLTEGVEETEFPFASIADVVKLAHKRITEE